MLPCNALEDTDNIQEEVWKNTPSSIALHKHNHLKRGLV